MFKTPVNPYFNLFLVYLVYQSILYIMNIDTLLVNIASLYLNAIADYW